MPRGFSQAERDTIRRSLIRNCRICWGRYGYQKTNVEELGKMSGISTGAFYQFYRSKEELFVETARDAGDELRRVFTEHVELSPDKRGVANGLKAMLKELETMEWYLSLADEFAMILRKLPKERLSEDFRDDMAAYADIFKKHNLVPKVEMRDVITLFSVIASTLTFRDKLHGDVRKAIGFIVDTVVENLFV